MVGGSSAPAAGQSVRVSVPEENFRKEPRVTGSNRLATVFEGTVLGVESRQGRWIRATLEGWVWSPSVSETDRDGFDLIIGDLPRCGEVLGDAHIAVDLFQLPHFQASTNALVDCRGIREAVTKHYLSILKSRQDDFCNMLCPGSTV